jgi:hypothetical protein
MEVPTRRFLFSGKYRLLLRHSSGLDSVIVDPGFEDGEAPTHE